MLRDRRAVISSWLGKQLQLTMENSTGSMSDLDYKSLVNQCLEICSALKDRGCQFSLSLRLGSRLNFSLSSEESNPKATKKRSPSYFRRQIRRRAAFLQRKKKLADEVTPLTPLQGSLLFSKMEFFIKAHIRGLSFFISMQN